jgi:hypothetical protein
MCLEHYFGQFQPLVQLILHKLALVVLLEALQEPTLGARQKAWVQEVG